MSIYLENRRLIAQGLVAKEGKKPPGKVAPRKAPLAKRSEKMKGIISALRPLYKRFLKDRPLCEIHSPTCTGQTTEVHHMAGRGVNQILDETKWKASCSACNIYVEENHEWARENGFKTQRHKKESNE